MRGLSQRPFRTLFDLGTVAGLTDGQLLERFANQRDEGAELAFAALVERHGPMVLHACRGIVRDDHEAMDVFQATFLVLASKGGTLWVRDSLGPWLHRVACRAAVRARNAAAKRRRIEAKMAERTAARGEPANDRSREELVAVIHEEVDRLPERYRTPIVLCDLEGRTCEEAARHLGCPVGTVGTRLSRGRQRLRDRLRRRGLAPNASLLAASMRWQGRGVNASISAELVGATSRAAVHLVSIGAVGQGAAASLALGVLGSMAMTHWLKVVFLLCVTTASVSGVIAFAGKDASVAAPHAEESPGADVVQAGEAATTVVRPGRFRVNLVERGTLEASRSSDVINAVEGATTILSIRPEGTRVKKGQLVCELDSASLKAQLTKQRILTLGAEAAFQNAKLTREVAEMSLTEYEGIYARERLIARREVVQAESAIKMAESRLKRTQAARDQLKELLAGQGGVKLSADVLAELEVDDRLEDARQSLESQRLSTEIAQAKRDALEKLTYAKNVKRLQGEVEKARSDEKAKELTWDLERSKIKKLEQQIASCKILAPSDGVMVYANDPRRLDQGQMRPAIQEGASVRERQILFRIPDLDSPMRVNAKVREAWVDQVRPGLPVTITVDAFPGQTFTGVVDAVAPLPNPPIRIGSEAKVYTTLVAMTKAIPELRPGMTTDVDIQLADLENVLTVPVQSLVRYDQGYHLAVKSADGKIEWRDVTVGRADAQRIEIKEGLKSGENVVIEPGPHLSEELKRKIAEARAKPAGRIRARAKGAK